MKKNKKGLVIELDDNEIFVFGSNKAGQHGGGAAKQAHESFGAEWGVGEGLTGYRKSSPKCYAFPTLDENYKKLSEEELKESVVKLCNVANENRDKIFLLTKVGTGIANYDEKFIDSLFQFLPSNIIKI